MNDIKRIIVAIDFSVYSVKILEYAAEIAWRTSSEIIAVSVINKRYIKSVEKIYNREHPGAFSQTKYISDEKSRRAKRLEKLVQEYVPQKVPTRIHIRNGIPFEEIIKVAEETDADLIIIAPQGKTNLPEYLFGSTSEKIFRHSPVTVLSLNVKREKQHR
jgi:nucleotide-binding universal stress UspA family protein